MWTEGLSAQREGMKEDLIALNQELELGVPRKWLMAMITGCIALIIVKRAPETEEVQCFIVQAGEDWQVLVEEGGLVHLLIARVGEREHQSLDEVLTETEDSTALAEIGSPTAQTGIEGPEVLKGGLTVLQEGGSALPMILVTGACLTPPYLMLILPGRCLLHHFIINTNNSHPWHLQQTIP